jgi:hypothetical protein
MGRAEDHLECERLVARYAQLIDFGEAGRVAELFTDDGVWEGGSTRMCGTDELCRGFLARERRTNRVSRHVCTNVVIDFVGEDEAHGVTYLTLYRHDAHDEESSAGGAGVAHDRSAPGGAAPLEAPLAVGEYRDTFVRTDRGWRIRHRSFSVGFVATDARRASRSSVDRESR